MTLYNSCPRTDLTLSFNELSGKSYVSKKDFLGTQGMAVFMNEVLIPEHACFVDWCKL